MSSFSGKSVQAAPALLCAAVLLTAAGNVSAGERTVTRNRIATGFNRSETITGTQGKSVSRESHGNWDADAKTWNKNTTVTGPAGKSVEKDKTVTRTEDGYVKSTTVTGPEGKTAEKDITVARAEDGYAKSTTVTGSQGSSAVREVQGHWNPETKTWTKSISVTGNKEETE